MPHVTEYPPAKTGEYSRTFPSFQNCVCCEKYLKDKKHSLHLTLKICSNICPWSPSVPQSSQFSLSYALENCALVGTDNVRRQTSEHIFTPNGGYCLYITQFPNWTGLIYGVCSLTHRLDALALSYWSQHDCACRLNVKTVSLSLSKNVK